MFPRHLDGGFHIGSQDDELGRSVVVMGAKAHDVDLSHSGPQNSEKTRGEQEGWAIYKLIVDSGSRRVISP
jgi:hypothetical protein